MNKYKKVDLRTVFFDPPLPLPQEVSCGHTLFFNLHCMNEHR